jgi:hypothetical protein
MARCVGSKAETNDSLAMLGASPLIHPNEVVQYHGPAGFLQRLPQGRRREAFAIVEMAGRLVVGKPALDLFLDHQVALTIGHYTGHGDVRMPDV